MKSPKPLARAFPGALLLLAGATYPIAPASAAEPQANCAAAGPTQPVKKKGLGLGGLLGAVGGSGLLSSLGGAARGNGDLEGAARAAASGLVERALACAQSGQTDADSQGDDPAAEEGSAYRRPHGQPTAGNQSGSIHPVPRAAANRRAAASQVSYPSDLPKPADFAAVKVAFDEFGKDRCHGCEGGYAYDSWPAFPRDEFSGKYNAKGDRMGSWPIGHVHRWKGNVATGTLTVVSEESVGGFKCRRLQYRLQKGAASAERPGLICWGRANQFAGKESWNEVY